MGFFPAGIAWRRWQKEEGGVENEFSAWSLRLLDRLIDWSTEWIRWLYLFGHFPYRFCSFQPRSWSQPMRNWSVNACRTAPTATRSTRKPRARWSSGRACTRAPSGAQRPCRVSGSSTPRASAPTSSSTCPIYLAIADFTPAFFLSTGTAWRIRCWQHCRDRSPAGPALWSLRQGRRFSFTLPRAVRVWCRFPRHFAWSTVRGVRWTVRWRRLTAMHNARRGARTRSGRRMARVLTADQLLHQQGKNNKQKNSLKGNAYYGDFLVNFLVSVFGWSIDWFDGFQWMEFRRYRNALRTRFWISIQFHNVNK